MRRGYSESSPGRRGSTVPAIVFATCCFGAIVASAMFFGGQKTSTAVPVVAAIMPEPARQAVTKEVAAPATTDDVAIAANTAVEVPVATESAAERVAAHLASGEFRSAIEIAEQARDVKTRTELLALIAQAHLRAGNLAAAEAVIQRMPRAEDRVRGRADVAEQRSLAGGASFADFQSLIDLIMDNTAGPWEEIDGVGGTISEFETGVRVNPNGMLHQLAQADLSDRLNDLGRAARAADLNDDMAHPSEMRVVSLTRLEQELSARLARGETAVESMVNLAGITSVRYLVFDEASGEILIGGPAEAWNYDETGRAVGVNSGRPALQLDDLVTVLRTFSDDGGQIFGCSINPRSEGLKAVKEFVETSQARGPLSLSATKNWVNQIQKHLGLQDIEIYGVPATSRVARVIVEADYKMKLIGVDKLKAGKDIPSYFDLLALEPQKAPASLDALRWWLALKYDAVLHSADHNVFELQGPAVRCLSENQLVTEDGQRIQTGQAEATNRLFAENFTNSYAQLAEQDLVFADLKNIFDLSMVAALIHSERLADRANWDYGAFAANGRFQPAVYAPPQVVDSVVNHRVFNGKDIVVQVAGGVRVDVKQTLADAVLVQQSARLDGLAADLNAADASAGRWWWDAAK